MWTNPLEMQMDSQSVIVRNLPQYLEASRSKCEACIDVVEEDLCLEGVAARLRFHHLRFDGNGIPKVDVLAEVLADHVIEYCFAVARRRGPQKPHEHAALVRDARRLFRKLDNSGEAGEVLLYLLMEAVLGAPQVIAKYDLKTNPKVEVHGSDGVHVKWDNEADCLDLYFGEAKLEQSVNSAVRNAVKSIEKFHESRMDVHERGLVTSHFKWSDDRVKDAIVDMLDPKAPGPDCRINHACLIGYDWQEYNSVTAPNVGDLEAEFKQRYRKDAPRLRDLLDDRFTNFSKRSLRFEVFFLPFPDVGAFRTAFINAL